MYEEKNYRCETEGEVNDPLLILTLHIWQAGRTTRVENGSFFPGITLPFLLPSRALRKFFLMM